LALGQIAEEAVFDGTLGECHLGDRVFDLGYVDFDFQVTHRTGKDRDGQELVIWTAFVGFTRAKGAVRLIERALDRIKDGFGVGIERVTNAPVMLENVASRVSALSTPTRVLHPVVNRAEARRARARAFFMVKSRG